MARVTHFDISTGNAERTIKFYEKVFGWKFDKWDNPSMDYWLITTGENDPGINGGMGLQQDESMPNMNTIDVESIDKTIEAVKTNGGTIIAEKGPIPTVGWFAVFKDSDGNMFGLMEEDEKAGV